MIGPVRLDPEPGAKLGPPLPAPGDIGRSGRITLANASRADSGESGIALIRGLVDVPGPGGCTASSFLAMSSFGLGGHEVSHLEADVGRRS